MRKLLASHNIPHFTMKPVLRNYAFEQPEVPHGQQYVLKVKYSGTLPALPLGLRGKLRFHICTTIILLSTMRSVPPLVSSGFA